VTDGSQQSNVQAILIRSPVSQPISIPSEHQQGVRSIDSDAAIMPALHAVAGVQLAAAHAPS